MFQSKLFAKTLKTSLADEPSVNAQLLTRGGFIYKNSAGIYTFLPLGWRVIEKISKIIRQEMSAIGGIELFMPALVEKKYMEATGRWGIEIGFKVAEERDLKKDNLNLSYVLGWTHEEVITEIATKFINSYKDLPIAVYQIQTKFRAEPRAKSGLLRCREFLMKDLYSFHTSQEDLFKYYNKVKKAYFRIFSRCDLKTYYTLAGGGDFTISNTHEFQVLARVGEDTVFYCSRCEYAENTEISILKEGSKCPQCHQGDILKSKAIEVGNIFPLGTKYSDAFQLRYKDKDGSLKPVVMGSYGIGLGRLMAAVVEIHHDENGIIWPESIAPFKAHLLPIYSNFRTKHRIDKFTNNVLSALQKMGIEVLYDDRRDKTPGEKFADSDLIGLPYRIVISEKTLRKNSVEIKPRKSLKAKLIKIKDLRNYLK